MKRRPALWWFLGMYASVLALGHIWSEPALAFTGNVCMQTNYTNHGLSQTLTCTANDVRVAQVTNIDITSGGSCTGTGANRKCTCVSGGTVSFTADYQVVLTAQTRYDIGIYFGVDGDPNNDGALTGACKLVTLDGNSENPVQLDAAPDACGDIDSAHNPQILHLPLTVACQAGADGKLKLPNCTSWRQSGANDVCDEASDAFPGSPSKCNCQPGFTIDILVEKPELGVQKSASPTSVDEPGGVVEYTVTVKNPAQFTSVTLTQLTEDDTNNNSVDFTYNATSTPTLAQICGSTTLAPCGTDPNNCSAASTTTCKFSRTVSGNAGDNIQDKACVKGTDSNGSAVGESCATATVSIKDVVPTAAVTKTVDKAVCAVVKYNVKVENTDTAESLNLSKLEDDKFGNIANFSGGQPPLGANVGTSTCNLPQTIAKSGNYQCSFEALVCTFAHTNTLTGTLNDNDGNTITKSGSATVNGVTLQ